jgi:hypothetical protein
VWGIIKKGNTTLKREKITILSPNKKGKNSFYSPQQFTLST